MKSRVYSITLVVSRDFSRKGRRIRPFVFNYLVLRYVRELRRRVELLSVDSFAFAMRETGTLCLCTPSWLGGDK